MGLGKSLTCVALLHALLNHPSLVSRAPNNAASDGCVSMRNSRLIRTVLLVVPTNVLTHWENEFDNWTGQLFPSIMVSNMGTINKSSYQQTIRSWAKKGGILLVSNQLFVNLAKKDTYREVSYVASND